MFNQRQVYNQHCTGLRAPAHGWLVATMPTAAKGKATPVATKSMGQNEPALRALVLRPEFASKFFLKGIAGKAKTLELRSHNLQCVKPGGRFFIAACKQGKNQHGVNVLKILGSVEFARNEHIKNEDVPKRYPEHLCPHDAYQKLSSKWQKDHCIGWVVRDAQMFGQPKWLQTVHQERCGLGGGVFMLGTCSWFMFVYLHPLTHVFFRFCV